jgi:hypothetical protein
MPLLYLYVFLGAWSVEFLAFSNGVPSPISLFSVIETKEKYFQILIPNCIRYIQTGNLGADFITFLHTVSAATNPKVMCMPSYDY